MAERLIEIRAGMDDDHFYIGYSQNPGNKALAQSVFNKNHYAPSPKVPYLNGDGSVTLQFLRFNLGFEDRERFRNFQDFIDKKVVPQLAEAVEVEVSGSSEILPVALYPENMSLFATETALSRVGRTVE